MPNAIFDANSFLGCFGDVRLARTASLMFDRVLTRGSKIIRKLATGRSEQVRFNRFLWNSAVTIQEMKTIFLKKTSENVKDCEHVLAIQDTTEVSLGLMDNKRLRGMGDVGNGTSRGFFCHPVLALDPKDNFVLGLASMKIWHRDINRTGKGRGSGRTKGMPREERESWRWVEAAQEANETLKTCTTVTYVCDREADCYPDLYLIPSANRHILVRSKGTRNVRVGESSSARLQDVLEALPPNATDTLSLARESERRHNHTTSKNTTGRKARDAKVEIRFTQQRVLKPPNTEYSDAPEEVRINVVEVKEIDPQGLSKNEKPIHWVLLTSHEVTSIEKAWEVVSWYKKRWHIEQLFRIAKRRGFDAESMELCREDAIEKYFAMMLAACVTTLQLTLSRDDNLRRKADLVFSAPEIRVLSVLKKRLEGRTKKQKCKFRSGTLAWAYWIIGRLGGWTGYDSEGPAGPQTLRYGLNRFHSIYEGWTLAQKDVCIG